MKRITALVLAIPVFFPGPMSAQEASDWFWEVGVGLAIPVDARHAFDGGSSIRLGVGLDLNPTLSLRLSSTIDNFAYDAERLA